MIQELKAMLALIHAAKGEKVAEYVIAVSAVLMYLARTARKRSEVFDYYGK